jgi:hypothetical protein
MDIIRQGSESVFVIVPMNCCFPVGSYGLRSRG